MDSLFKRFACMVSDTQSMALQGSEFGGIDNAEHQKHPPAGWAAAWAPQIAQDVHMKGSNEESLQPTLSVSSASSYSALTEASEPVEWPVPCSTPFALVQSPLEIKPHDFAGRTVDYILSHIEEQLHAQDQSILLSALNELEKLSFRASYVQSMAHENQHCLELMARVLQIADIKPACKAAVVLWNCGFQVKSTINIIKQQQFGVIESLGNLISHDDRNCRYAASGCLSVLTAASASCRARCVASGALVHLVACLYVDDGNLQYHAGGTVYYIAQHPEYVAAIVQAGAVPAYQRLLGFRENANNVKLAKRALGRLGVMA